MMATLIKEDDVIMDGYAIQGRDVRSLMFTRYMKLTGNVKNGEYGTVIMSEVTAEFARLQSE